MTGLLLPGAIASALLITTTFSLPASAPAATTAVPAADVVTASASADMVSLTKYITYDNRAYLTGDDQLTKFRLVEEEKPEAEDPFAVKRVVKVAPKVVPTAVPTVQTQPVAQPAAPKVLTEEQLNYLGSCEAGMDPTKNTGNGYYGAFQFSYGTWKSMGTGYERADLAPLEVQKEAVQRLVGRSSIYTQFPGCANKMRNAGII